MAMYLTNGTLNYNLTKEYILTPEQIAERNNMIPDYPDPNDERFKETLPVFTLENNQLCRDGVSIGKIYNNKTGKVVEITETTETGFKYQDTEEDALINKDNSIAVVEKLTGLKGEVVKETRLIATYNVEDASNPTPLFVGAESVGFSASTIYDKIEIDNVEIDISDLSSSEQESTTFYSYQLTSGEHTVKYTLKDPTMIGAEVDEETHMPSKLGASFINCPITSVKIPNSVTSIGSNTFYVCSSLTEVTIPNTVTNIGEYAFLNCTNLTNITIPDSVTSIGFMAFYECSGLTNITIGKGVTSIDDSAFQYCTGLTSVAIPNSVTSIGNSAFANCSGLTSTSISNNVTRIEPNTFYECVNLTNVTIGSSVTSIGTYAFYYCSSLMSITSLAITAPTIKDNTFYSIKTNGTLTVPAGATGYDAWMDTSNFYLGSYNWTKVEQS